jgi:hypothetical protein
MDDSKTDSDSLQKCSDSLQKRQLLSGDLDSLQNCQLPFEDHAAEVWFDPSKLGFDVLSYCKEAAGAFFR